MAARGGDGAGAVVSGEGVPVGAGLRGGGGCVRAGVGTAVVRGGARVTRSGCGTEVAAGPGRGAPGEDCVGGGHRPGGTVRALLPGGGLHASRTVAVGARARLFGGREVSVPQGSRQACSGRGLKLERSASRGMRTSCSRPGNPRDSASRRIASPLM